MKISGLRSVVDKVVVKDLNPKIDMQLYEPGNAYGTGSADKDQEYVD